MSAKRSMWQGFLDALTHMLADGGSADQLLAQLAAPWQDLMATVRDMAAASPDPADAFLNDADDRRDDQLTTDEWCQAFAEAFLAQYEGQHVAPTAVATDAATIAAAIRAVLKLVKHLVDPETFLRYAYQLRGHLDPRRVATTIAKDIAGAVTANEVVDQLQWPAEVPSDDDVKEQLEAAERPVGLPADWIKKVTSALSVIPGSGSNTQLGNRIHRKIMANYRGDNDPASPHGDHLVVLDGRCWLELDDFRVSAALENPTGLSAAQTIRLERFNAAMRSPKNGRRVRPDIADLADAPSAIADDWGWFEIKPFKSLAAGLDELHLYYLPMWNLSSVTDPAGMARPGSWFPPLIYADHGPPATISVCVNVYGCIGYLVFQVEAIVKTLIVLILGALFDQFMRKLSKDVRRLVEDAGLGVAEGAIVVGLVALLVAILFFMIVGIAKLVVLGAEVIGVLAVGLAQLEQQLASWLAQLQQATPP